MTVQNIVYPVIISSSGNIRQHSSQHSSGTAGIETHHIYLHYIKDFSKTKYPNVIFCLECKILFFGNLYKQFHLTQVARKVPKMRLEIALKLQTNLVDVRLRCKVNRWWWSKKSESCFLFSSSVTWRVTVIFEYLSEAQHGPTNIIVRVVALLRA